MKRMNHKTQFSHLITFKALLCEMNDTFTLQIRIKSKSEHVYDNAVD